MKSYHNTTYLNGFYLTLEELNCKTQEEIILQMFKRWIMLSASEVFEMYPIKTVPLTSIRRAMSNLANEGELFKTDEMTMGIYGKQEHYYELAKKQLELF